MLESEFGSSEPIRLAMSQSTIRNLASAQRQYNSYRYIINNDCVVNLVNKPMENLMLNRDEAQLMLDKAKLELNDIKSNLDYSTRRMASFGKEVDKYFAEQEKLNSVVDKITKALADDK